MNAQYDQKSAAKLLVGSDNEDSIIKSTTRSV